MRKIITQILTVLLLASVAVTSANAANKKGLPKDAGLSGSITAVDKEAKTITIAGKTVTVDETTAFIGEGGKPATFADVQAGKQAVISTVNLADKLTAVSVKLGQAPSAPAAKKKK